MWVELCRALLGAKLFMLIPQAPVDGAEAGNWWKWRPRGTFPGNPGHARIMRTFVPFYAAPGYKVPARE